MNFTFFILCDVDEFLNPIIYARKILDFFGDVLNTTKFKSANFTLNLSYLKNFKYAKNANEIHSPAMAYYGEIVFK